MNSIWINVLVVVQIVAALAMIGLVLVQRGKGADMGVSFGSGASGSLFGATGSANFLSRSTAVCAAVFFASTVGLVALHDRQGTSAAPSSSVLEQAPPADTGPVIPTKPTTAPEAPATPAAEPAAALTAPAAPAAPADAAAPAAPAADASAGANKDAAPVKP